MKAFAMVAVAVLVGGCVHPTLDPDHGNATAINFEAQVVHPDAATSGSTADGMDGIKAGIAIEEYKTADNKNRGEKLLRNIGD